MEYYLMWKNEIVTAVEILPNGTMNAYAKKPKNPELLPLQDKIHPDSLIRWWTDRRVPIGQGKVEQMLKRRGLLGTGEYLTKNLGLSLTDFYWIKPINSSLKWEDVNLFDNDFRNDLLPEDDKPTESRFSSFTPNSSLQGELEKSWVVRDGGRYLVKGNRDEFSQESINEVIASNFHAAQGYDNYTEYRLLKIKGKKYNFGCCSKAFTSQKLEFVPAYAVITSEIKSNSMSVYEHFIQVCENHGINPIQLRADLEYQILTDFIFTNIDRHLNNVGILRDADTLRFLRMAPIFDTGKSFFIGKSVPADKKGLKNIEVNSFAGNESKLLKYVKNYTLVTPDKALSPEQISSFFSLDSKMEHERIEKIVSAYQMKLEMLKALQ